MDPIVSQVVEQRMRMYPFYQKPLPPVATTRPPQPPIPGPEEEAVTSDIDPVLAGTVQHTLRLLGLPAELATAAIDPHLRPLMKTLLGDGSDEMTDALERGFSMLAAGRPTAALGEAGEVGAGLGVARGFGGDIAGRPTSVLPESAPTGPIGPSGPWQGAAPQTEHFFGKGYISPPTMHLDPREVMPARPTAALEASGRDTQLLNRGTEALTIPEAQAAGVPGGLPYPMFHGSKDAPGRPSGVIQQVGSVLGNSDPRGLQGPGFYKTDNAFVAEGYRGPGGTLYNVWPINPNVKFLDEFDAIPKSVLQRMAQRYPQESLWRDASRATAHQPSWGGVYQQIKSEPQRLALLQELQREGYGGIRHEGGRITGTDPHQVEINWDPQRDVRMRAAKTDLWGEPIPGVAAPAIQTPLPKGPTIRPPAEPTGMLPGGEELARATGPLPAMEQDARFHGTPDPIEAMLKPSMVQAHMGANLQGPGFYTTNNYAVGEGYAGSAGPVYRVWETRPGQLKFLDAEHDIIPDHVLKALSERFPNFGDKFATTFTGQTPESFFQRFSNFRDRHIAQAFVDEMQKEGYDGVRYTGGLRTGGLQHEVKVYWDPDRDIRLRPINRTYMQVRSAPSGFATGGREVVTPVPTMGSATKLYPHPKPPSEEDY